MKTSFLLFLICLFSVASHGQSPPWVWANSGNTAGSILAQSVGVDAAGNSYVAGTFNGKTISFGTIVLTNPDSSTSDIFMAKYDSSGNVLWAKRVGGIHSEGAQGIAVDSSGSFYVTGFFSDTVVSFGSFNVSTAIKDAFVARFDAAGNPLWVAQSVSIGSANAAGQAIAVDPAGACYVTGSCASGTIAFGTDTLIGITGWGSWVSNVFIVKYDAAGNLVWARRPSSSGANGRAIATDRKGNCYVTGDGGGTMNFGNGVVLNGAHIYTVRYNPAGTAVWARTSYSYNNYSGGSENSSGIANDTAGNCYVTGTFSNTGVRFASTSPWLIRSGPSDIFLVKYDSLGTVLWAKNTGGLSADHAYALAVDRDGNSYVVGAYHDVPGTYGNIAMPNPLVVDGFVAKFDDTGAVSWAKAFGGIGYDEGTAVALNRNGNCYVAGHGSSVSMTFGTVTLNLPVSNDGAFLARLSHCAAVPSTPSAITSSQTPCAGSTVTYSVPPVAGATSYIWTLPGGWTGTSTTNTIAATVGTSGGTVIVKAVNSCGPGSPGTLTVPAVSASPIPFVTQVGNTLSTGTFSSYQWYFNNAPIPGATGQSYAATKSGLYYVIVKNASACSGKSNTVNIPLSVKDAAPGRSFVVYPNPVHDQLRVQFSTGTGGTVSVSDLTGRILRSISITTGTTEATMDTKGLPGGVYLFAFRTEAGTETVKLIKE
jgi:hypothetical protein